MRVTRTCLTKSRVCIDCQKKKRATSFYIKNQYRILVSGERVKSLLLMSVCKTCSRDRVLRWRVGNREKYLKYQRDKYASKYKTKSTTTTKTN